MGVVDVIFPLSPGAEPSAADAARRPPLSVITCMDPRVDVGALMPRRSETALVIRNAGGLVTTDVLRSLELAQQSLGARDVTVIHHTDCAGLGAGAPGHPVEEVLRRALNTLLDAPDLRHDGSVRGFVLDVDSGRVREVSPFWSAPARAATAARGGHPGPMHATCATCGRPFVRPAGVWRPHRAYCSAICRRRLHTGAPGGG